MLFLLITSTLIYKQDIFFLLLLVEMDLSFNHLLIVFIELKDFMWLCKT